MSNLVRHEHWHDQAHWAVEAARRAKGTHKKNAHYHPVSDTRVIISAKVIATFGIFDAQKHLLVLHGTITAMTTTSPRAQTLLRETSLREFVAAGAVTEIRAVGRVGGYELHVLMGAGVAMLGNTRGGARLFGSLDSITAFLQRLGIQAFEVDITQFAPAPLRTLRAELTAASARKPKKRS